MAKWKKQLKVKEICYFVKLSMHLQKIQFKIIL